MYVIFVECFLDENNIKLAYPYRISFPHHTGSPLLYARIMLQDHRAPAYP